MQKSLSDRLLRRTREQRQQREFKRLQAQYRGAADPRRFEIDWGAIHFNRISIVNLLLARRPNSRYLEIGCDRNELFDSVIATDKVGVDPERGGTERLTSDAFFRRNGGDRYDVVFIDGLHTYEQTRRDVVNALRCLGPGGWIGLHDMWPLDWLEEHVPRVSLGWTGDVWKVAFELARTPGIEFKLLKIDHGVGLARRLAADVELADRRAELADKRFGYFFANLEQLPVTEYADARAWIERNLSAPLLRP